MSRKERRSVTVQRFPTTERNKFIEISVAYCEGGPNYFSGDINARGYYMHVTPVEIETRDNGVQIRSFKMFHGRKKKLEEVKRFSQTRFLNLVEQARLDCANREDKIMQMVNFVANEEKLALAEEPEVTA